MSETMIIMKKELLVQKILQNVKEGNAYQAYQGWGEFLELERSGTAADDLAGLRYDMIGLAYVLLYALSSDHAIQFQLASAHTEFIKGMQRAETMEECTGIMEAALQKYCSLKRDTKMQNYSALTQNIVLAVDRDLTKPLTLQYFAESLSVNGSYLSDLFKREVGMTITDYVTSRRIEHAKGLLTATQNPIKMIAKMVGIPDVQYFSKIFKRRTGMTPSVYRKAHAAE